MTKFEMEKELAELKQKVDTLVKHIYPSVTDVQAEVRHLVRTLGLEKAAEEISRRNRLRRII